LSTPAIRGWCPGTFRPMASGDGLIARVAPPFRGLAPAQMEALAALATGCGNGLIDLSNRGNLQVRGLSEASYPAFIDGLRQAGLIDTAAQEEPVPILVQPFWREEDGTLLIAEALRKALAGAPPLPSKFGIAVDTGKEPLLCTISADIRIERQPGGGLMVRPDGADRALPVAEEAIGATVLNLIEAFVDGGGVKNGRGRMRDWIVVAGNALDSEAYRIDLKQGFRVRVPSPRWGEGQDEGASSSQLRGRDPLTLPSPHRGEGIREGSASFAGVIPIDDRPTPNPGPIPGLGILLAGRFGQIDAAMLAALARTGRMVRVTPWRMLLVMGEAPLPAIDGLIADPDDPTLRTIACTGAPACAQGLQETRPLAALLAPPLPPGQTLHVSGCGKGCASQAPASLTLVGQADGFQLVRAGKVSDMPVRRGLSHAALLSELVPT
jgi:precorrin-3B synthase